MFRGELQSQQTNPSPDPKELPPVRRCELCNKPFDRQSTLKRHGYYCRSRKVGQTNRSRSCACCAKAKVRCDGGRPACLKCTTKNIQCRYPSKPPTRGERGASRIRDNNRSLASESTAGSLDSSLIISGGEYPDIDHDSFWNDQIAQAQQVAPLQPFEGIPPVPSLSVHSMFLQPSMKAGTNQKIVSLILHNLRSYPQMIRQNTLPPFIHPQLACGDTDNGYIEPLANCISLMYMIGGGMAGSRKLFWKNVRLECEKLFVECQNLSPWQILAAMQAISIYIFVRIDEGEKDYNDCDHILLSTVISLAQQYARMQMVRSIESEVMVQKPDALWEDWVFKESCRRLNVIYRIINMLIFNFAPATLCGLQPDLILAPLPAKKPLWEAGDESAWSRAGGEHASGLSSFALTSSGDVVRLMNGPMCGEDILLLYDAVDEAKPGAWEEWCAGMDSFGTLVMLAASLVG